MEIREALAPCWAEQRVGRTLGCGQCCWTLPEEADRASDAIPGPGASAFFFSCLPSPTWEMKLLGWATEAVETRLLRGSGVPCLGSGGVAAPPTLAPMMEPGVPSNRPRQNVSISAEPTPCPHPTSEFVHFYFLKRRDCRKGLGSSLRVEKGLRAPEQTGRTFEQSKVKGITTKNPSKKTGSMEGMVDDS